MKTSLSYQIPPVKDYSFKTHVAGINKIIIPSINNRDSSGFNLFSAGRDGLLMKHYIEKSVSGLNYSHQSTYAGHTGWVNDICYLDSENLILSASSDGSISLWDVDNKVQTDLNTNERRESTKPYSSIALSHLERKANTNINCFPSLNIGKARTCKTSLGICLQCPPNSCSYDSHTDYVTRVCYAPFVNKFVSGGLDKKLILWDLNEMRKYLEIETSMFEDPLNSPSPVATFETDSIYALDVTFDGNLIAYGSTSNSIKVIDTRSNQVAMSLNGHSEIVRSVLFDQRNSNLLSGSSDGSIKLWSLNTSKTLVSFNDIGDGVWCLQKDSKKADFSQFYVGTRSGEIRRYSFGNHTSVESDKSPSWKYCFFAPETGYTCCLLGKESASITSIALQEDYLWVSTSNMSDINCWENGGSTYLDKEFDLENGTSVLEEILNLVEDNENTGFPIELSTTDVSPCFKILGSPGIRQCKLLEDRRHLLTMNSQKKIILWDIIKCEQIRMFDSRCDFEQLFEFLNSKTTFSGAWCSVDISLGFIVVIIEESRLSDCEAYADELKLDQKYPQDQRINIGRWVLHSLLGRDENLDENLLDPASSASDLQSPQPMPVLDFRPRSLKFHKSTILTVLEDNGDKAAPVSRIRFLLGQLDLFRLEVDEALPMWICKCLKGDVFQTNQVKHGFKLCCMPKCGLSDIPEGQQNLTANRMIRVRKLLNHSIEKAGLLYKSSKDIYKPSPEQWLEIVCEERTCSPLATLGTIKQRLSSGKDPILYYRPIVKY